MLSVQLIILCLVLFERASAIAPGDEHPLCTDDPLYQRSYPDNQEMLMDSYNYHHLLRSSRHSRVYPRAVWKQLHSNEQDGGEGWIQTHGGGTCKHGVRVCDYFHDSDSTLTNWLLTQYIQYQDANEVFVNVSFNFGECHFLDDCNKLTVEAYLLNTNISSTQEQMKTSHYEAIGQLEQPQQVFGEQSVMFTISRPKFIRGFYLGFKDKGTCGKISRVQVYYNICPSKTIGLTTYPRLALPQQNSSKPSYGHAICGRNSRHHTASGYVAYIDGRCEYRATCECKPGYKAMKVRNDDDQEVTVCQGFEPPSTVEAFCKTVTWDPLNNSLNNDVTGYDIMFYIPGTAIKKVVSRNVTTHHYVVQDNDRLAEEVEGAETYVSVRAVGHSTAGEYSTGIPLGCENFTFCSPSTVNKGTTQIPRQVTVLDVLNGVLIWSPPDMADQVTQYNIRLRRNDTQSTEVLSVNQSLNVYSLLSSLQLGIGYTVQVQAINEFGAGKWSSPFSFLNQLACRIGGIIQGRDCCQISCVENIGSGVYLIDKCSQAQGTFSVSTTGLQARCDMETDEGGWLVILRRKSDASPLVNFTRTWTEYENGFGDLNTEFWYGLRNMHCLTQRDDLELRIDLQQNDGSGISWTYQQFKVAGPETNYTLTIGGGVGTGDVDDRMANHNDSPFSTYDRDNDGGSRNCANIYKGAGWWFYDCSNTVLTAPHSGSRRIYWGSDYETDYYPHVEMKVRPKSCLE